LHCINGERFRGVRPVMNVRVEMYGMLRRRDGGCKASFDLALHDGVTAGELVRILAERCGAPLCDAIESSDTRLPRHIRMFSDGEMLSAFEQPLAAERARETRVNIVVLSPMMGG
jgi:hypothetical protein